MDDHERVAAQQVDMAAFDPRAYLTDYYSDAVGENRALLAWLALVFSGYTGGGRMLDLGTGPTIWQLISAALAIDEVVLSDLLQPNRDELRDWLDGVDGSWDWEPFVIEALAAETGSVPSPAAVAERCDLIRSRVTSVIPCDVFAAIPAPGGPYDLVSCHFVLSVFTTDREVWLTALRHVTDLVAPDGHLLLTEAEGDEWHCGPAVLPCLN